MIFFLSIASTAWYFFYLDLDFIYLLIGGVVSVGLWLVYRNIFLNFDGGKENPLVVLGMVTGGFGAMFSLISMAIMKL